MTEKEAKRFLHPETTADAIKNYSKDTAIKTIEEACLVACNAMGRLERFENWLTEFKYANYHLMSKEEVLSSLEKALGETLLPKNKTKCKKPALCEVSELAKYIIVKCLEDNHPINNLTLQNMLYYIRKQFIAIGLTIFSEPIEAWKFGPCVPSVYYKYCGHGASKIYSKYPEIDISLDEDNKKLLDDCIETVRGYSPWEFSEPGGAWEQAFDKGRGDHRIISELLIKEEALGFLLYPEKEEYE